MIWLGMLVKTLVGKVVRKIVGDAGDTPVDPIEVSITEMSRIADDMLHPRGPIETSHPLPWLEIERQRRQAQLAARPETARPPPLPEPLCPVCEHTLGDFHTCVPREPESFPATFPVTEVQRTADTVRPGKPSPPRPVMPHSPTRAAKRLPPPPRKS